MVSETGKRTRDVAVVGRGIQPVHVRQTNQRAILSVISLQPGISNAELARITDLAPQTVSSVLADLESRELVTRGDVLRGRRGQPATPLYMNPVGAFSIGAEIGWRHVDVCLVGIGTQVLNRYRREYEFPDATKIFDEVAGAARDLCAALSPVERKRLTGLGLATPITLNTPPALMIPSQVERDRWAKIDVTGSVERATGLKTSKFVDGHAACWAQRVAHPAPRPLAFVFCMLDTCMSGGIVSENRLWEGSSGASGNLGELLITTRDGPRLAHEMASIKALQQRLADAGLELGAVTGSSVAPAAATVLDAWIEDASTALAQTIINSTRVLEFEFAVIETALPAAITSRIVETTRRQVTNIALPGPASPPIIAGHLGRSGAAQGAALLRMHRLFFSRELAHMAG
jgi:predicted NBD/HSP70 family sugar kinase